MIDPKKAEKAVRERLPRHPWLRISLGLLLLLGGVLGFLPVLGFWMIPLGLLVLSYDLPLARRLRRRLTVWWHGRGNRAGTRRRRDQPL